MVDAAENNVPVWRVREFTSHIKHHIEQGFSRIRIQGELRGVLYHRSGHLYAQLREDNVVVDVVCWKPRVPYLGLTAEDGMEVIITGNLTIYGPRSRYQLVAEKMELAGEGALLKMLQDRREKLAKEGLFGQEHKQKLPLLPERVGVITSPLSAAMFDIAKRSRDRLGVHLLIWPATMQGTKASDEVIAALRGFANAPRDKVAVDVIIIARGGGSLEDLLPFSDEQLVREVAACRLPVVSAIGHESDTCLLDEVADVRAATPTAAAELVIPERQALVTKILFLDQKQKSQTEATLHMKEYRYQGGIARLMACREQFSALKNRVLHHGNRISYVAWHLWLSAQKRWNRIKIQTPRDVLLQKRSAFSSRFYHLRERAKENWHIASRSLLLVDSLWMRLKPQSKSQEKRLQYASQQLNAVMVRYLSFHRTRWQQAARLLVHLDEQVILKRGFVLVRNRDNQVMTKPQDVGKAQHIQLQFAEETLKATIVKDKGPKEKILASEQPHLFSNLGD